MQILSYYLLIRYTNKRLSLWKVKCIITINENDVVQLTLKYA